MYKEEERAREIKEKGANESRTISREAESIFAHKQTNEVFFLFQKAVLLSTSKREI